MESLYKLYKINNELFLIHAMEQIFSFGERWNVPFHSISPRGMNISSFTSWKYLYHCTHKHSLFAYYLDFLWLLFELFGLKNWKKASKLNSMKSPIH